MAHSSQVECSFASIEQAWEASGDDFSIRLITSERVEDAVDAAFAADEAAASAGIDIRQMTSSLALDGFALEVGPALWSSDVHTWVHSVAENLGRRGVVGRVVGGLPEWGPPIMRGALPPALTLFARFGLPSTPEPFESPRWRLDAAQTRSVVRVLLEWALTEPGSVFVTQNSFTMRVEDASGLQAHVQSVLQRGGSVGIDVVDESADLLRHATIGVRADCLFQVVGPARSQALPELIRLARELPPPLDLAYIRIAHRGVIAMNGLDAVQPLPGIRESHVRYNQHLLNRYVPDAHGVQIVSDAHLNAAHDLSTWTVKDLGQGRHLVAAADLAAWFRKPRPDSETLDQARADWAGAILTEDAIATSKPG